MSGFVYPNEEPISMFLFGSKAQKNREQIKMPLAFVSTPE